jgi:hypothetical protein
LPPTGRRFFPLYPLVARVAAPVFAGRDDIALLVVANAAALVYGALLYRLVRREGGDHALARRAAWLVALVPPAFVLAFGYAEALAGCLAVGVFLGARSRRWWWAALAGFLSGMARPSGVLLAVPVLVEAVRGVRRCGSRELVARAAAVAAPAAGVGVYLAYIGLRFGDPMYPIRVQNRAFLRGGFRDPAIALYRAGRSALGGHFAGNGFHVPGLVILIVLAVVAVRRWPASYSAFAVATLVVTVSARRFGSVERYGFAAFPLVLALASLTSDERVETAVVAVTSAGMVALTALALLGAYVP